MLTVSPQSSNAKMSFEEGSELIDKLGLRVLSFGKDLDNLFKNMECTIFLVVTRLYGDELYHLENLTDPKEMSLLRDLIRCRDLAGLSPEWRTIKYCKATIKVYLAGQDPGISQAYGKVFLTPSEEKAPTSPTVVRACEFTSFSCLQHRPSALYEQSH